MNNLLTTSEIIKLTTLSRASIERKVKSGDFPAPIYISQRRKAWRPEIIEAWMSEDWQKRGIK